MSTAGGTAILARTGRSRSLQAGDGPSTNRRTDSAGGMTEPRLTTGHVRTRRQRRDRAGEDLFQSPPAHLVVGNRSVVSGGQARRRGLLGRRTRRSTCPPEPVSRPQPGFDRHPSTAGVATEDRGRPVFASKHGSGQLVTESVRKLPVNTSASTLRNTKRISGR